MRWDVFCHVIDNYGDIGVCWRLSAELAARGESVRLWVDDPAPLGWMAPHGAPGVTVERWTDETRWPEPGDIVIEAFGCNLPAPFVSRMAQRQAKQQAPVWINLEYLSAEPYAARSHRLPSPQLAGPGAGLHKLFFYPGFTPDTGGLLRERDLVQRQAAFDAPAWRSAHGIQVRPGERIVSLFCYEHAPVPALIESLAAESTLLLATSGIAARLVAEALGPTLRAGALRAVPLPVLTQVDFDHLLWSCDLNFVRGEDSFVRAMWAARPFLWHIYPQSGDAHACKLHAFDSLYLHDAEPAFAAAYRTLSHRWNGLSQAPMALPPTAPWHAHQASWHERLLGQTDLVTQLRALVH